MAPNESVQLLQKKIFYAITLVTVVLFTLSLHFAPAWGLESWGTILIGWGLLFLSLLAAACRLSGEATGDFFKNSAWSRWLTRIQIWTLVFGILAHLIFSAQNYVYTVHNPPEEDNQCYDGNGGTI